MTRILKIDNNVNPQACCLEMKKQPPGELFLRGGAGGCADWGGRASPDLLLKCPAAIYF